MKKLTLIVLLLALALLSFAGTASAAPVDELTALAEYARADAPVFVGFRTDEAMINTIDDLINHVGSRIPGALPPDFTVRDALDESVGQVVADGDFATSIRPWMGATGALFVPFPQAFEQLSTPVVVAFSVTDRDAAEAYLDDVVADDLAAGDYEKRELPDALFYQSAFSFRSSYLLADDVMLIGSFDSALEGPAVEVVLPGADRLRLPRTDVFQETLAALPGEDYAAVAYLDLSEFVSLLSQAAGFMLGPQMPEFDAQMLTDAIGQQALGFTVTQDRSLVMDFALVGDLPELDSRPVDMAFLERVPADTAFLILDNGLGNSVSFLLDNLGKLDRLIQAQPRGDIAPLRHADGPGFEDLTTFMRLSFEGTTGLDLEETLAWMNGDYAVYMRAFTDPDTLVGSGFVIETDNPGATADYVAAMARIALDSFAPATFENGVLTIPLGALFSMPDRANIVLASNDEIMAFGTNDSVDFALEPSGDSVASTDAFAAAQDHFLADTHGLAYINVGPVREAAAAFLEANPGLMTPDEAQMLDALLSIVDSASVTATKTGGGVNARFTLTLGG